ncbi:MAG: glutamate--cysteine ligase [Alphaproteobacteria bacterium]|nr:MAG: glutamate--cysteine ligase [Alphaproteobacteria bacterium]
MTMLQKSELIEIFTHQSKPRSEWKIGVEFERFAFNKKTLKPLPFSGPVSTTALLQKLIEKYNWQAVYEGGNIVALRRETQSITLEPGGAVELSGATLPSVHHCCKSVSTHMRETEDVGNELDIGFLTLGFDPKWDRSDFTWVPKKRYDIMRNYMPRVGDMGIDMMLRTATVQVNLDYESESDMIQKTRIGLALQPIIGAMFSNSPFKNGGLNQFQSYRNHVWLHTDPARTGNLPFMFDSDSGFEKYADYLLDVPMYFVIRNGQYIDASGQSFRDFMAGKLPALPGEFATVEDWKNHITCVFPIVRLKPWIEMRGADGGSWEYLCALPALWTGLLYDADAQLAMTDLIKNWTADERRSLHLDTPKMGLHTKFQGGTVIDIARQIVNIAEHGLKRRDFRDKNGADETYFLNPLKEILQSGKTQSDLLIEKLNGEWGGKIDQLFNDQN